MLPRYDADLDGSIPPDLELANYGFTEADMDREVNLDGLLQGGFIGAGNMKLRDVIARLNEVYSSSIGVEYMHIWDHEQVNWIREQIETPEQIKFTKEEKMLKQVRGSKRLSRGLPDISAVRVSETESLD